MKKKKILTLKTDYKAFINLSRSHSDITQRRQINADAVRLCFACQCFQSQVIVFAQAVRGVNPNGRYFNTRTMGVKYKGLITFT